MLSDLGDLVSVGKSMLPVALISDHDAIENVLVLVAQHMGNTPD